ncbi:neuronal tyrosine-phosphorylated phosphoinositide-3-kinase adapter 2 [Esox lucius]|uniref:Neuronal tyrosine-phosphorylated phosphoinositide-3-kinase adaptor 2b n=1 Tax=Esox lucius TaxID=8010 RepID=A0A6Q2YF26_ESOLU|nr:neuronal tyrosine-phosphorylated phosphoinositide-3-kinase adapter 2 [Esox lucius]
MMSSKEEESLRFFQYVEDSGLRAYKGLVSQNLDHARNERNKIYLQEKNDKKRKQEEAKKRTGEEVVTEGKHLRMGSMTMPAPPERVAVPPYLASGPGFAVRSQSLHSVGGGDEEVGSPTSRKQPPPKPRRDPATKLSISSETVDHSTASICRGCRADPDVCDAPQGCGEDCKRVPPPKPRRNPNTQLSTSFDESYIRKHSGSKGHSPSSERERNPSPPSDGSPSHHSDSDEPVYIEMGASVGGAGHTEGPKSEDDEPGESVYEEMKYPLLDDMDYRWDPPGCRSACPTPAPLDPEPLGRCSTPRNIPLCDIPAPFPNLLSHRPPLLVFPPAPAQCSPNSDESPLTPLDALTKLPMMDSPGAYSKSPTSSSSSEPPTAHLRRELTATPTLTVSGRSSAPPLPCTLYKSSASSAHGYQRSHSACPSPVSMGRCLTPLSLMRAPAFDASAPFPGGMPRSASATPHGKGSPPQDSAAGGRLHGSMQNVSTGRSRTPTSPLDELTNLFTAGRNMMKKNASGRKSKEPGETESSKSKTHGESRRDGKERHGHSKESKRESKERSKESSSHRRDAKDRGCSSVEPPPVKRDSKERGCSSVEPLLVRRDSKDRGTVEPPPVRRDSKGRGCGSAERMPRRDSKDKSVHGMEPILLPDSKDSPWNGVETRHDSKERPGHQNPPELLPRQDSKDRTRSVADSRQDSKERTDPPPELLPRQNNSNRDSPRNGLECRRDSKDRDKVSYSPESRHEVKDRGHNGAEPLPRQDIKEPARNGLEARRDSKDRSCNGSEVPPRRDSYGKSPNGVDPRRDNKDRVGHSSEALARRDSRDRGTHSAEQPKAQEKNGVSGQQTSMATPTRHGRHSGSPPMVLGAGSTELKPALQKYGRSSAPVTPSPLGTPQRQAPEAQVPQMPWMCGDSMMLEQIERKRTLCMEIRSRQRPPEKTPPDRSTPERNPPDRNLCKQESLPALPTWGKSNVAKKIRPPPYPTQTTVFWDTAI